MKTFLSADAESVRPKSIEARFIRKIEQFRDDEVRLVMLDRVVAHAVACVNWQNYPYKPEVKFRIAHSDDALALMFEVEEEHLRGVALSGEEPVWEDSCVEFFVENPLGEGYFNFEVNCIGTLLAAFRRSRTDADAFTPQQRQQIRIITSLPQAPISSRGGGQKWWVIEIIPLSLLGLERAPRRLRCNFYKCGDKCDKPHFLSWAPINLSEPNFHCPEFFGEVILV